MRDRKDTEKIPCGDGRAMHARMVVLIQFFSPSLTGIARVQSPFKDGVG
jgi:hypothetical protein